MRKVIVVGVILGLGLLLWGCGISRAENEANLTARVEAYHSILLSINDPQKAADDEYAAGLLEYLSPTDRHDAKLKAEYLQSEWLKRNLRAIGVQKQNYITVEALALGTTGKSAVVNVTVSRAEGPVKRAEKWVKVDGKWYRTLEFTY